MSIYHEGFSYAWHDFNSVTYYHWMLNDVGNKSIWSGDQIKCRIWTKNKDKYADISSYLYSVFIPQFAILFYAKVSQAIASPELS